MGETSLLTLLVEIVVAILYIAIVVDATRKYTFQSLLVSFGSVGLLTWIIEYSAITVTNGYYYSGFSLGLLNVPLAVPLGWIIVNYAAFEISVKTRSFSVGVLSGWCIDLLLEPLALLLSLWVWQVNALSIVAYWNAPLWNAVGWILLCYAGIAIFHRTLKQSSKRYNSPVFG